jgi:hypothetical protein
MQSGSIALPELASVTHQYYPKNAAYSSCRSSQDPSDSAPNLAYFLDKSLYKEHSYDSRLYEASEDLRNTLHLGRILEENCIVESRTMNMEERMRQGIPRAPNDKTDSFPPPFPM